ncbi:MAG: hypothetical protein JAY88_14815 [Candidatus Thiodiazotropha lotti]|nr:hypothetical protein [Candidatus Thiodiazotropha lotti]MCW4188336.1 hypothetical protein [Candidatus Thiodiazotropha lotti]
MNVIEADCTLEAKVIAQKLKQKGITVKEIYEYEDLTDAGLDIDGTLSLQIPSAKEFILSAYDEKEEIFTTVAIHSNMKAMIDEIMKQKTNQ